MHRDKLLLKYYPFVDFCGENDMPPTLYLIDGHALAYRTYFALTGAGGGARWQTNSGEPTAGSFGFTSALLRLLERDRPEYLAVAFDTGKTFRDELYPQYKATRAKMPEDLRPQIERIRQLVDAFHFPRLEVEGFEADDVLGSIACQAVEQGLGVKIITGDRDLLQLVNERIIVNLPDKKSSETIDYNSEKVVNYLGVRPDQIIDYKALVGDPSDNIPGVAGIGNKTAVSLFQKYNTLEEIYAHLEDLPSSVQNKLISGREAASLSRKLATIRKDVPVILKLDEARTDHINFEAVESLFRQLEFRTLINRLHLLKGSGALSLTNGPVSQQLNLFNQQVTKIGTPTPYTPLVHIVTSPEILGQLVERLQNAERIAFDTETTSTNPLKADLVGISLAVNEGEGYYIPIGHRTNETQLPLTDIVKALKPSFCNSHLPKIGHNIKFDYLVLSKHGLNTVGLDFDTMIAGWVVLPESRRLGLKDMAEDNLGIQMTHIEELIGKGKNQRCMADIGIDTVATYAVPDAEVALRLQPLFQKKLDATGNSTRLFKEIEMPLIPVLAAMEQEGIALDVPFLEHMSVELNERLVNIENQVQTSIGYPFNLNSTQQLSKALFETLKLEPPGGGKRTMSGHLSTSADVLEELRGKHAVVDLILEYRELAKLKSTYIDALPQQINPSTGRVHTSFNQIGTVTGRLASSEPNLQNIPTRTEIGHQIRQAFIANPDNVILAIDYSQIELRILAHMSNDIAMLAAFRAGQDIHAATAAAIYNIPLDQVTKDMRRHAKTINFGLIYGMSAYGLYRSTGLTLSEAENFREAYFARFPGVSKYMTDLRHQATQQGYVETLLGRRRNFPNLSKPVNAILRAREEREAINAPIQGTAADIMKLAMIHLIPALVKQNSKARLLLQVHDELVLECSLQELQSVRQIAQQVMESAYKLSVPMLTEASYGKNWGSLTPFD